MMKILVVVGINEIAIRPLGLPHYRVRLQHDQLPGGMACRKSSFQAHRRYCGDQRSVTVIPADRAAAVKTQLARRNRAANLE
jgi:hypothetical protein